MSTMIGEDVYNMYNMYKNSTSTSNIGVAYNNIGSISIAASNVKKENNMLNKIAIHGVDSYIWRSEKHELEVKCLDGSYHIFDEVVSFSYSPERTSTGMTIKIQFAPKKTATEVAKEVNEGKWGYGADRIQRLKEAGYSYNEVQSEANRLLYVPYKPESKIKNVIFNDPATIVFWSDGTKTVVKCGENDIYDPEKGLAMAVAKKYLGTNKSHSNYMDEFKKWLPKEEEPSDPFEDFRDSIKKLAEIGGSLKEKEND